MRFNLVRTQDSEVRVIAIHVRAVTFEVTSSGVVIIDLTTYPDVDKPELDLTNRFQIAPRNTLQM